MSNDEGHWDRPQPDHQPAPREADRLAGRVNEVLDDVDELAWQAAQIICFALWCFAGFALAIMISVSTWNPSGGDESTANTLFIFGMAAAGGLYDLSVIRPRINLRSYGRRTVLARPSGRLRRNTVLIVAGFLIWGQIWKHTHPEDNPLTLDMHACEQRYTQAQCQVAQTEFGAIYLPGPLTDEAAGCQGADYSGGLLAQADCQYIVEHYYHR